MRSHRGPTTSHKPVTPHTKCLEYSKDAPFNNKSWSSLPEIPPSDCCIEWKKQKEETASAHNILGFKDHKAAIHHPNLAETNCLLCEIPNRIGFLSSGHQNAVDYQILKKAGICTIEKMHIIQLMVTAFNNKQTDHQVMQKAKNTLFSHGNKVALEKIKELHIQLLTKPSA